MKTLIERGGGTGPMKPGSLCEIKVPIPAAQAGWMMRGRVRVFNGALFLKRRAPSILFIRG
jgi:hypothetical protein